MFVAITYRFPQLTVRLARLVTSRTYLIRKDNPDLLPARYK